MTRSRFVVTSATGVGPQRPVTSTPAREAGSIRRTSNVDVVRPDGATGAVEIAAFARDFATGTDGAGRIVASRALRGTLLPTLELSSLVSIPAAPELAPLVGRKVAGGFRNAVVEVVPDSRRAAGLLYLLLDDLPVATLVSGYALQRADLIPDVPRALYVPTVDLCAGWQAGGTLMQVIETAGMPPMTLGPAAPALERADDIDAWHEIPTPQPHTVRRRRRIDLTVRDQLDVDAMFRDSHFDDAGLESVVHEYSLVASIDPATLVITAAEATPRVLPYVECPTAGASAARLVGLSLDHVRDVVRSDFVGTSTCTHLNDLFRSLEDVRGLLTGLADTAG